MKNYLIVTENVKELADLTKVAQILLNESDVKLTILDLSVVYHDSEYARLIRSLPRDFRVLRPKSSPAPLQNMHNFQKVWYFIWNKRFFKKIVSESDVVISGIQTIFTRYLYKVKKTSTTFVAYHRHLLFDDGINTNRELNKTVSAVLKLLGMDYFHYRSKGVGYADKYMVLGEVNKNYLIEKGINSSQIIVTGNGEQYSKLEVKESEGRKVKLCFISGAYERVGDMVGEQLQQKKLEWLARFVSSNNDLELFVKVHPRESFEKYESWVSEQEDSIKLHQVKSTNIIQDLEDYDYLVGTTSTLLFECEKVGFSIIYIFDQQELNRYRDLDKVLRIRNVFKIDSKLKERDFAKLQFQKEYNDVIFTPIENNSFKLMADVLGQV